MTKKSDDDQRRRWLETRRVVEQRIAELGAQIEAERERRRRCQERLRRLTFGLLGRT
jgi:hypothetical protein